MTKYPNNRKPSADGIASEFLSTSIESLISELYSDVDNTEAAHFDVIIVGSGYGGATAASELSKTVDAHGKRPSIAILERGSERLPGSFPEKMSDVPDDFRLYRYNQQDDDKNPVVQGQSTGLFDIRVGNGTSTLLANGLGGGSLINAGVLLKPAPAVFEDKAWPCLLYTSPSPRDS